MISEAVVSQFDFDRLTVDGAAVTRRYLADVRDAFADRRACDELLSRDNPLLYYVGSIEPTAADGGLHYGYGVLMPGRVGDEYFLTKGHLHARREAAEVYVGLRGSGVMLLEDERSGESRLLPLIAGGAVYVPGYAAHRTINTGGEPLAYVGVYPASAGHDYGAIAERNFRQVVVERDGRPTLVERADYLQFLQ